MPRPSTRRAVAFVWDNFGPMHADRCDAVALTFGTSREVIGIELFPQSQEYDWNREGGKLFHKITLYQSGSWDRIHPWMPAWKIVTACRTHRISDVFLCNYDQMGIFMAGILLRLGGYRVYVMGCSKYDDNRRTIFREAIKRYFFFLPYQGAIASGRRSRDYMRFLGIPEKMIATEYNTLSTDRIRRLAGLPPAPDGCSFEERHFTIVARFIPKKNLFMALEAYAAYCKSAISPRPLHLCGSGPLEDALRVRVAELGLQDRVIFHGFLQSVGVARILGTSLALILPSSEEQFGNVVIEAQSMGLPIILSDNCGARDNLVRSGLNGFVVEPDNPHGLSYFMQTISEDKELWARMSTKSLEYSNLGDVKQFAFAVLKLVSKSNKPLVRF